MSKPASQAQLDYLLKLLNKKHNSSHKYISQVPEVRKRFNACVKPDLAEVSRMIDKLKTEGY